jgi:pimeloyl-ACP methyl ester carboxylesterase
MGHVTSADGTRIAYHQSGSGPPLVLVHGTTADHSRWAGVSPALEPHFTVYAVDRRGRGGSGDGPTYHLLLESEDIAAVVEGIGGPVDVMGHSYGAICCLEAAVLSEGVRRLVLYEPPLPVGIELAPPGVSERVQALVDQGEREEALLLFFREVVRMPEPELAVMRALPVWQKRVALARTIPRELGLEEHYRFDADRVGGCRAPTLLLLGGDSPPSARKATEVLDRALPDSRVVVLPGQQHVAMDTDPETFLRKVLGFLLDPSADL